MAKSKPTISLEEAVFKAQVAVQLSCSAARIAADDAMQSARYAQAAASDTKRRVSILIKAIEAMEKASTTPDAVKG